MVPRGVVADGLRFPSRGRRHGTRAPAGGRTDSVESVPRPLTPRHGHGAASSAGGPPGGYRPGFDRPTAYPPCDGSAGGSETGQRLVGSRPRAWVVAYLQVMPRVETDARSRRWHSALFGASRQCTSRSVGERCYGRRVAAGTCVRGGPLGSDARPDDGTAEGRNADANPSNALVSSLGIIQTWLPLPSAILGSTCRYW